MAGHTELSNTAHRSLPHGLDEEHRWRIELESTENIRQCSRILFNSMPTNSLGSLCKLVCEPRSTKMFFVSPTEYFGRNNFCPLLGMALDPY